MRSCLRLFCAAFLTDASLYLAFAALPFRAIDLGAGPARLGILPTLYAAAYMLSATIGGRLSDRFSRLALARGGCGLFFAGCLALATAPSTALLFLALPVLGLGLGFFWSPLQAAVADRTPAERLAPTVAGFNVAWSLGKGTGLVLGGVLTEALQPQTALLVAGFPVLVSILLLPRAPVAPQPPPAPEPPGPARPDRFVPLAWATNALAFGTASTLNMHAPKLLLARGGGPAAFGVMLGSVFVVQTATFAAAGRFRPSRATLRVACALGAVGVALFLAVAGSPLRIAAAVPLGIAFGLAYHASIHASLDRPHGRGRAAGLHEMLLGAGSSSLPLLGGAAAAASGSLAAPFLLAGAALLAGLALVSAARSRGGPRPAGA
jgi:predicted MFS family arabinose efflux permease